MALITIISAELSDEEIWEDTSGELDFECNDVDESVNFDNSADVHRATNLVTWLLGCLFMLQTKHYIPSVALDLLFKLICTFFGVIGRFSPFMSVLASQFPKSLHTGYRYLGSKPSFKKSVVCPRCMTICSYEKAQLKIGRNTVTNYCSYVAYPNHTQRPRRQPCKTPLLKTVELLSGRQMLYPFKVYCYQPLMDSLQKLLLQPGFCRMCEHWRKKAKTTLLEDVYDGRVWKKFQFILGSPFLDVPYCFAVMLNVDWFQPFKHTTASVGVLYLTILNIPRHLRYKRENILLKGVIPGPSEPTGDINTFLRPLVAELTDFWIGITMKVNEMSVINEKSVRCALLCVACDLPAGRKVCGFLSHNAAKGCSKCLKVFSGSVGNMDFSGFNRSSWPKRTDEQHRKDVESVLTCKTKTSRSKKESELGCRYSVLLDLIYFDAPTMLAVDPMHNLFLGTGK